MKIRELISKLKEFGPDLEVFLNGYEGGYEILENITPPLVMYNEHKIPEAREESDVYGTYEVAETLDKIIDEKNHPIAGIILERKSSIPCSHLKKE